MTMEAGADGVAALASADGTRRISVLGQTLSLSGTIVTITQTGTISTLSKASTMIGIVNSSIANVNSALAKLASGEKKFIIQQDFVSKLMDSLKGGIGNLVDADAQSRKRFWHFKQAHIGT